MCSTIILIVKTMNIDFYKVRHPYVLCHLFIQANRPIFLKDFQKLFNISRSNVSLFPYKNIYGLTMATVL